MLGWELPPHFSGGLGVACYGIAKALVAEGSQVDFVVPYSGEHPDIDFMTVHCATDLSPSQRNGLRAYDSARVGLFRRKIEKLVDIRDVQKQYARFSLKLARKIQPDVVHAHDWLTAEAGMAIKKALGIPLVLHIHATEFDRSGGGVGNELVQEIEAQGMAVADQVLAVSQLTKNVIMNEYKIPSHKIKVAHNAIDVEELKPDYQYNKATYNYLESLKRDGYTVVVTITRLTIQKGLVNLLRAFAMASKQCHKLVFLLAGSGEQRDELLQVAADLGIADKVFFTGFITGQRWRDAYTVGDVFVMSSISEPFGLTALEAAHYDNALILTKQSGVGEVLNNVLKYDFWDEERLANQLVALATSPALKNILKQNVKKEYLKLSWRDVAKFCQKVYSQVQRRVS